MDNGRSIFNSGLAKAINQTHLAAASDPLKAMRKSDLASQQMKMASAISASFKEPFGASQTILTQLKPIYPSVIASGFSTVIDRSMKLSAQSLYSERWSNFNSSAMMDSSRLSAMAIAKSSLPNWKDLIVDVNTAKGVSSLKALTYPNYALKESLQALTRNNIKLASAAQSLSDTLDFKSKTTFRKCNNGVSS